MENFIDYVKQRETEFTKMPQAENDLIAYETLREYWTDYVKLILPVVVGSSDKIVIEFSDNELLIVTKEELQKMQESAIEFDGFESWTVKGRLV